MSVYTHLVNLGCTRRCVVASSLPLEANREESTLPRMSWCYKGCWPSLPSFYRGHCQPDLTQVMIPSQQEKIRSIRSNLWQRNIMFFAHVGPILVLDTSADRYKGASGREWLHCLEVEIITPAGTARSTCRLWVNHTEDRTTGRLIVINTRKVLGSWQRVEIETQIEVVWWNTPSSYVQNRTDQKKGIVLLEMGLPRRAIVVKPRHYEMR